MTDFAWLDEISKRMVLNNSRLDCASNKFEMDAYKDPTWDDVAKLIETVKVMREAFECIERETDCPATQTTILNALEKCK